MEKSKFVKTRPVPDILFPKNTAAQLKTEQSHFYIQSDHSHHKTSDKYSGVVETIAALDKKCDTEHNSQSYNDTNKKTSE